MNVRNLLRALTSAWFWKTFVTIMRSEGNVERCCTDDHCLITKCVSCSRLFKQIKKNNLIKANWQTHFLIGWFVYWVVSNIIWQKYRDGLVVSARGELYHYCVQIELGWYYKTYFDSDHCDRMLSIDLSIVQAGKQIKQRRIFRITEEEECVQVVMRCKI